MTDWLRSASTTGPTAASPRNARQVAFRVLQSYRVRRVFVGRLLDEQFGRLPSPQQSAAEWRLASELAFGIVRRKSTLNALIERHLTRPRHQVESDAWTLLQIGVYQLVFFSSVPAHAAVHETVELAKWLGKSRWSGFINGVLRAVQRDVTDETTNEPAADAVPLNGPGFRRLLRPAFPDPHADPVGYFVAAFSFPPWLARRWYARFGSSELFQLGTWFNTPPAICLRPNRLRTTREELLQRLGSRVSPEPPEFVVSEPADRSPAPPLDSVHDVLWLTEHVRIPDLPGYDEGLFVVQDPTAMEAVRLLAPEPGQTILDLCAAPGTKTVLLAEQMQNQGRILATDVDERRLDRVRENSRRLGVEIVETRRVAPDGHDIPAGPFDAVLVDVPCSNTGVLGKRPEARWRIQPRDLEELAAVQRKLLAIALARVRPGGRVVYCTCSIEPEENENVVQAVLRRVPGVRLETMRFHHPGRPSDGGYQALLIREDSTT
ncbi:MAG: hypothetical protein GXP27_05520 [Planctomycetes bacterium]|nr:hypothetical protein [Planctomycetota bacterium]